ncbi:MAG TPA: RluA family pseudouridine synthase [Caulobacteraceae bacterium]|nr:RluA family pseudouridine synthase [Caulobacteraceae bacterium]
MKPARRAAAARPPAQGKALSPDDVAFVRGLVIHEDDHLIALDKPAGLSSQGGRIKAHTLDDLLGAFAKASGNRPRLVHRLDRDTSGVILTARTKPAAAFLGKAMMGRKVRKTYLAIVAPGAPEPPAGTIEAPLRRVEEGREAYMRVSPADHPDAEAAFTRYRTLASNAAAALVELAPRTGRMHQLRVHLASSGRPNAGDARYGGALVLGGAPVPRLMLHAAALQFPHPAGGETRIAAPLPADFTSLLDRLGLARPDQAAERT